MARLQRGTLVMKNNTQNKTNKQTNTNSLHSPGWFQTHDSPASAPKVLVLNWGKVVFSSKWMGQWCHSWFSLVLGIVLSCFTLWLTDKPRWSLFSSSYWKPNFPSADEPLKHPVVGTAFVFSPALFSKCTEEKNSDTTSLIHSPLSIPSLSSWLVVGREGKT